MLKLYRYIIDESGNGIHIFISNVRNIQEAVERAIATGIIGSYTLEEQYGPHSFDCKRLNNIYVYKHNKSQKLMASINK